MALFRLCKATRRLRASTLSLQLTRPVLSPPIPNPKTPSHSSSQSFTTNLFNALPTHTCCLPNCIYIQENHNFRAFNSTQLVKNAGISTLGYEKKDENEKKEESKIKGCSWIDLYLPKNLAGYAHLARLDKPIGTWLLAWPCMWYALLFLLFLALVCVNL
uniref:4-hydroxybenzoate polyprenyltransferase, mitochondrial n=1 Tax=Daucus carota subsp. sativus TaxID=79200 RepID=A0A175YR39_DAUCS